MAGVSLVLKLLCFLCLVFVAPWTASAALVQQKFIIGTQTVTRVCNTQTIVTVNGQYPGPTITVHEGDNLIIEVDNNCPYNITLHWHGVKQFQSGWADGPAYVTQCPIIPGNKYTYNFTITGQEGTLWWHAHITYLRATVHGALIVLPRIGNEYPFPKPEAEFPLIIGEWWNANVEDVLADAVRRGAVPNDSNAYTINSQPGDFYPCSANDTSKILVEAGKSYLLRIVNCAMVISYFFKIAQHTMTVVAVDSVYTKPYTTDVLVVYPGNTIDVLITADQKSGLYYIAIRAYSSEPSGTGFLNTTTTAILQYTDSSNSLVPVLPSLPAFNDTALPFNFKASLRTLKPLVPQTVDEEMFITEGVGVVSCPNNSCAGFNGGRVVGSFNNISFVRPDIALLQAYFYGINGVFTRDFPGNPPLAFDYTGNVSKSLWQPQLATKVKVLQFNSTVQIVFQNTAIVNIEEHPIHLHGHNFYLVGQGFGNYNPQTDPATFNLVDPVMLNTFGVPTGGWAAIRFTANNPEFGFDMVFLTLDGPGCSVKVPPPPADLPKC
ncbi:laccase-5 isoform X2 [Cryptomeria japonica]|uniref:laccase-5 isoform X2 n=1 Tax=Cryptomeria japonica TaxID=3369 RepID=UPI0027DA8103|nr:laccase-5 isoform X2 [Cryptomeria japonica]